MLFVLLWVTVVYFPLCHMVWGKGGYFNWALGGRVPVLDFAGGTVVHISSGVSALVCALVLGKRTGYPVEPMLPHNVVLSLIAASEDKQRQLRAHSPPARLPRPIFRRRRRR